MFNTDRKGCVVLEGDFVKTRLGSTRNHHYLGEFAVSELIYVDKDGFGSETWLEKDRMNIQLNIPHSVTVLLCQQIPEETLAKFREIWKDCPVAENV